MVQLTFYMLFNVTSLSNKVEEVSIAVRSVNAGTMAINWSLAKCP